MCTVLTWCVLAALPLLCLSTQKGPIHFVEPCPDSFTIEEWTTLSQEDLPLITKLIGRPAVNSSGQKVLVSQSKKTEQNARSPFQILTAFMS